MQTVGQYRDVARRLRSIADESVYHQIRLRLLQLAHELEQEADVREDVVQRLSGGERTV